MPVEYYQLAICVAADAVAANKAVSRDLRLGRLG